MTTTPTEQAILVALNFQPTMLDELRRGGESVNPEAARAFLLPAVTLIRSGWKTTAQIYGNKVRPSIKDAMTHLVVSISRVRNLTRERKIDAAIKRIVALQSEFDFLLQQANADAGFGANP